MGLSSFDLFEQIEEYEYDYRYSGWIGNPAEETFPYDDKEEVDYRDF